MKMGHNKGIETFGRVLELEKMYNKNHIILKANRFDEDRRKKSKNNTIICLAIQKWHSDIAFFPQLKH